MFCKVILHNGLEFISLLMKQELVAVVITSMQCKCYTELNSSLRKSVHAGEVEENWAGIQGQKLVACLLRIHRKH